MLQSGAMLRDAKLAYKSYGNLSSSKDNVIVYPTWYSGQHYDNEWLIGDGMALDPARYFIIIPNMLGNGLSSAPSNTPPPYDQARFPKVTAYDNVRLQHRLVREKFGIERVRLVTGWSMGALQTFHWGALYPQMVECILPFCGSAKCSRHNFVFLEGVKAALTADAPGRTAGTTSRRPRACAPWPGSTPAGTSRRRSIGSGSISRRSVTPRSRTSWWRSGRVFFLSKDANNLLTMLWIWQNGDISANETYHGDFDAALGAIRAKAIVMPGQTDLYFPPEDSEYEVAHMPNAELRPMPSIWGHFASGPGLNPDDVQFLDRALKELLAN